MESDGGPAFPGGLEVPENGHIKMEHPKNPGMSLRDYFAGQALAGEWASQTESDDALIVDFDALALRVYAMADAMLEARKG